MADKPEVKWDANNWERRDYPTIMDGWVVRYTRNGSLGESEISASRNRIVVDVTSISAEFSLACMLDIIQRAWRQHLHLAQDHRNDPLDEEIAAAQTCPSCMTLTAQREELVKALELVLPMARSYLITQPEGSSKTTGNHILEGAVNLLMQSASLNRRP